MLIRAGTSTSRRDQTEGDEAGHGAWPARWSWALGRARAAATVLALAWVLGGCSEGPEAGSGQAAPGGTAGVGGARPVGGGDGRAVVRSVVMVCLDTLRADRLEAYGYGRPTSPNLDALASRSVVFDQARAQAPQTAPSHASLFTSEYPGAHGIINVHGSNPEMRKLPAGVTTLAEFLSQQGITTAAFVSGGNLTRRMDMHRGFGLWDERNEDIAQRLAAAVAWLDQHQDRPFFLFIHSYQVQAPYLPPPEYQGPFVHPDYADLVPASLGSPLEHLIRTSRASVVAIRDIDPASQRRVREERARWVATLLEEADAAMGQSDPARAERLLTNAKVIAMVSPKVEDALASALDAQGRNEEADRHRALARWLRNELA